MPQFEDYRTGQTIGPYRLLQSLGVGGFGEVWLAEDTRNGERFAAKILSRSRAKSRPLLQRLPQRGPRLECRARSARHPPADPLGEVRQPTAPPQRTRAQRLSQDLDVPERKARPLRRSVCADDVRHPDRAGIPARQHASIFHRDLKPENVLLFGDEPRLADFGLSLSAGKGSRVQLTQSVATWEYAAPEVYKSEYRAELDIWAAGVILYRMLAGRLPFPQPPGPPLMYAVMQGELPPLPDTVPPAVRAVVQRALAKNPLDRFRSAAGMRSALEAALASRRAQASAPLAVPVPPADPAPVRRAPAVIMARDSSTPDLRTIVSSAVRFVRALDISILMLCAVFVLLAGLVGPAWLFDLANHQHSAGTPETASGPASSSDGRRTQIPDLQEPGGNSDTQTSSVPAKSAVWSPPLISGKTRINKKDGAEMVWIPAGSGQLGDTESFLGQNPPHQVTLSGYYIYKNLVTVAQYRKFCLATKRKMPTGPAWGWKEDHPIVNVSWNDARLIASGQAFDFRRRRSGSTPRAVRKAINIRGGMIGTALSVRIHWTARRKSGAISRMSSACLTWRETFGNGARTCTTLKPGNRATALIIQ